MQGGEILCVCVLGGFEKSVTSVTGGGGGRKHRVLRGRLSCKGKI